MAIQSKYQDKQIDAILNDMIAVLEKHQAPLDLSLIVLGNMTTTGLLFLIFFGLFSLVPVMRLSLIGRIRYSAKFTSLSAYLGILVLLFSPFICWSFSRSVSLLKTTALFVG